MFIEKSVATFAQKIGEFIWGWPLVIFVVLSGIIITLALKGIQFRYFFTTWKYVLFPEKARSVSPEKFISPFQAFINTLSASIGNGTAAGMATAMYSGGPGAAFWIFVLGFLNMAVRYAEVFASTYFVNTNASGILRGGPMVFLKLVPGKHYLPTAYAFFTLFVSFVAGSAMQCNSMRLGIERMTHLHPLLIATILFCFILYTVLGGAQRIMQLTETIIPIKVGLFFISTCIVLFYHYQSIAPALAIIIKSAFSPQAVKGALIGHTLQNALRYGMSRSLSATEAGLGTAGILFGATGSKNPVKSGIMSMASIIISNYLVCFLLMLIFVASGVWDSGLTSTALTSAAYETVFGNFGGWLVTFLSVVFGIGAMVAYAYIGRECWLFLTKGRSIFLYNIIYCAMAFIGAITHVDIVWNSVDIGNAGMMIINVYGLLVLLPQIRKNTP